MASALDGPARACLLESLADDSLNFRMIMGSRGLTMARGLAGVMLSWARTWYGGVWPTGAGCPTLYAAPAPPHGRARSQPP
jgi:hypothetical protein